MLVMQSVGGAMRAADAEERAVNTLASGPAGGVVAARHLGEQLGHDSIICADMGGTSFDVGLIVEGEPIITSTTDVNQYTLLVPTIDIVSIGAGGGSIAWVDLGRLRVGPQSAGADPGPACYGRGGVEPTVTDANLLLGYLGPGSTLAGGVELDAEAAGGAVARLASGLGLAELDVAEGIVRVANQEMG